MIATHEFTLILNIYHHSSEIGVYAYAAAQVKKAIEVCNIFIEWKYETYSLLYRYEIYHASYIKQVTHYLGGENYVFWGGREGYQTLLNTDMERELDHMVRLWLVIYT